MSHKKLIFVGLLLMGIALALAACGGTTTEATPCPDCPEPAPCPEAEPCPEPEPCPEAEPCPEPVVADVPYEEAWLGSGHADAAAEAFRHWDEDSPQEVPVSCAKCHTPTGYLDFLGLDGSAAGTVDNPQPVSNGITCVTCHNEATATMASVVFPSGAEVEGLGDATRCMLCHQGRASTASVDSAIATAALTDTLDTVSADLRFINIHYFAAAATLYGTEAMGGYEYAGNSYDGRFRHVEGYDTCIGCHNPHTLEVRIEQCAGCHEGVASVEDLANMRMFGSVTDYDGDGDITEGIAGEIAGLQGMLMTAIQAYANEVSAAPIGYDSATYPYFFFDTNANGVIDPEEANGDNRYTAFTARLLRAAYNYQVSVKDPGAFAHNAKYIIELLYDSIADLNTMISTPVDLSTAHRIDAGHFAFTEEAFRHWDEDGEVPAGCARCHSATGLPTFIHEASASRDGMTGINIAAELSAGFACSTCHDVENWPARYTVNSVRFNSGAAITFGDGMDANLCILCHQGRASTNSVNTAIGDAEGDTVTEGLTFRNPHYFAAGATVFGGEAHGAYEFADQTYQGRAPHVDMGQSCVTCHDVHGLTVNLATCATCHPSVATMEDVFNLRLTAGDFDGDGDSAEGIYFEVMGLEELLYAAIQNYAATTAGVPIVYDAHAYPYFFADANGNGTIDEGEASYATWTPNLLRAAYNYQWVQKDPGAFAHNSLYILQVLYDSIAVVGGDVTTLVRQ